MPSDPDRAQHDLITGPDARANSPSWTRRSLSATYEGVLLFGVVFVADYLFDTLTQSRHALMLRPGRMLWLFLVLGTYFSWFWSHGGQTLPMKTWRIRLVEHGGAPVSAPRAVLRYLLCWCVILPGPALVTLTPLATPAAALLDVLIILMVSLWMQIDPERASLYDRLLGTRLVDLRAR